ncbi:MAG: hypothetical protein V4538_17645 [Bacteroidota bacterium]
MTQTAQKVNVAPSSSHGHFIEGAKQVINLDNVNETFQVKGESRLTTNNHTTLELKEDCLITCQTVYDPFSQAFTKSRD